MNSFYKNYIPYRSPFDPCPPIGKKVYSTPPQLYIGYQPYYLDQFNPKEALAAGTLWKKFYDPYYNPYEKKKEE
ncbi:CotJA [Bacillus coahuilensis m2-6]|uniref:CotJA n=1 Tax=Bacillus coahuilensis p1.1.43 TaxID=1150625 RepID=A0A147K8U5_9BACI|nr:spore coat associated protein CotJA [Bacillus coahuilensis]KUP06604.1 CotJA [Bacillus coahuilensis p1.1.43]KUP07804.1 CotJA [Bacillus coahuilensis m2-6]